MNQEEKIKAYLLNQLPPDETAAFRTEILQDPDLMGEVKATKLLLIAKELKYREELREKRKKWEEEGRVSAPPRETWVQRYGVSLVLGILVLGLVGYGIYMPTNPPPEPEPPSAVAIEPTDSSESSTSAHSLIIPLSQKDSLNLINITQKRLAKFSNAILSLEIIKNEYYALKDGNKIKPIKQENKPETGFILAYNSDYYVVTNAYSVKDADNSTGDVIGKNADGQEYKLKLIGLDDFYDIAVLSIENEKTDGIQALELSGIVVKEEETVFAFNLIKKNKTDTVLLEKGKIQKNYGDFLRIGTNTTDNLNGPVINPEGAVVGMNSQYARSLFPDGRFRKYILEQGLMAQVISEIIQKKGDPPRPYSGIAFSTNDAGKVIVYSIIKDSPNYLKQDLIGKEVKSINGIKINTITDVAVALQKIRPGESFLLVHSVSGLTPTEIKLRTENLQDPDIERITRKAIETTDSIQYKGGLSYPVIRFRNESTSNDDFRVFACQIGENTQWRSVNNSTEFGKILRHIALVGKGLIKVFKNSNPENESIIEIKYKKPILWN